MTLRSPQAPKDGFSLIEIVVVLAIVGIIAVVLSNVLVNTNRFSKHLDVSMDLVTVKATAINLLDCQATIGAKNQCLPSDVFQPKMANGSLLFPKGSSSNWNVSGYCKNNRLLLQAVSAQKDAASQKILSVPDIFQGAAALCTTYFNPVPSGDPCQTTPQVKNGVTYNHSNGPNQPCCRYVDVMGAGQNASTPVCLTNLEYVRNGGSRCWIAGQTTPNTFCNGAAGCVYMHESWFDSSAGTVGWDADCEGNIIWDNSIAEANAVCCPFQ